MDRYTGITCNPLIHQGDTDIFDSVFAGAKTFYGAAKRYLNDNFDVQMISFGHALLLSLTAFTRCTVKPQIYRGLLNRHTYTL